MCLTYFEFIDLFKAQKNVSSNLRNLQTLHHCIFSSCSLVPCHLLLMFSLNLMVFSVSLKLCIYLFLCYVFFLNFSFHYLEQVLNLNIFGHILPFPTSFQTVFPPQPYNFKIFLKKQTKTQYNNTSSHIKKNK